MQKAMTAPHATAQKSPLGGSTNTNIPIAIPQMSTCLRWESKKTIISTKNRIKHPVDKASIILLLFTNILASERKHETHFYVFTASERIFEIFLKYNEKILQMQEFVKDW